ncbi:TetR/AcrR family transcriptional regulator [Paenibacillus sp. y28]|uniref:TetR/AcrR family transcriptional regulator n=1 Tax=Paenibacillus sp. y28 TaxID=3129110 RepID=UPI00301940C9
MTAALIKQVALKQFAAHGYEGASLALIAEEVGIKKQSIYTHFSSKDDLFLDVLKEAARQELRFTADYFTRHTEMPFLECLLGFLKHYKERYSQDDQNKFWLRMMYFPPSQHREPIIAYGYEYMDRLQAYLVPLFIKAMDENVIGQIDAALAASAFFGVLDAVLVEMLFGGEERFTKRLEASWYMYLRGLSLPENEHAAQWTAKNGACYEKGMDVDSDSRRL